MGHIGASTWGVVNPHNNPLTSPTGSASSARSLSVDGTHSSTLSDPPSSGSSPKAANSEIVLGENEDEQLNEGLVTGKLHNGHVHNLNGKPMPPAVSDSTTQDAAGTGVFIPAAAAAAAAPCRGATGNRKWSRRGSRGSGNYRSPAKPNLESASSAPATVLGLLQRLAIQEMTIQQLQARGACSAYSSPRDMPSATDSMITQETLALARMLSQKGQSLTTSSTLPYETGQCSRFSRDPILAQYNQLLAGQLPAVGPGMGALQGASQVPGPSPASLYSLQALAAEEQRRSAVLRTQSLVSELQRCKMGLGGRSAAASPSTTSAVPLGSLLGGLLDSADYEPPLSARSAPIGGLEGWGSTLTEPAGPTHVDLLAAEKLAALNPNALNGNAGLVAGATGNALMDGWMY